MPQAEKQKNHFVLNKGLNTESSEIAFPDGFTTDEQNYELLVDGSRRRRKGLALESGGSNKASGQTLSATQQYNTFRWRGVGGDPTKNVIVHQVGPELFITQDTETISTTYILQTINTESFVVDNATTAATVGTAACQFASGRGRLFVSNKHLDPFYVEFNDGTGVYTATPIKILVRDFDGIEDGIPVQSTPAAATEDHTYNLRNQGWRAADIVTYDGTYSAQPSKHVPWFKGYRRITNVGFSDLDGIQTFDEAKIRDEQAGTSKAPMGSLFLYPSDTTFSAGTENEGDEAAISTIGFNSGDLTAGGTVRIVTTAAHGRTTNDVINIQGHLARYLRIIFVFNHSFDGAYTATVIDPTTIDITWPATPAHGGAVFLTNDNLGVVAGNPALPNSSGADITVGPEAIAYHGARVWYAGIESGDWADTVFFSKIAQKTVSYGQCYQEADPTNPEFNLLSSSDGGMIVIPTLGSVKKMVSLGNNLLVFSDNGVWEIGGGQRGIFTATGYSVRKITDVECTSVYSPIVVGDRAIFTSQRGIYQIGPNQFTGINEATNVSEQLVQTLWNAIPTANQEVVKTTHDDALNRVYFLYGDSTIRANEYNKALILDLKIGAYYKYAFNNTAATGIVDAFSISGSDSSDASKKIKWTIRSTDDLIIGDLDQLTYVDWAGTEEPLPFMVTGHDNIGDFQRRRQAPIITVFAKRTETGYTDTGNGFDPINESSNLLTAYWDFTDDSVSGKIGSQNQTYRHVRQFVPSGPADVDGYPVVITRNKVRGRGRVLQLRFDGEATKDSHLMGFSTNYKITRKV